MTKRPDPPGTDSEQNLVDSTIGREARIVSTKSIRLPEGLCPRELLDDVRRVAREHIERYKITHREVAQCVGASPSVISQVLSGSYLKGDAEGWLRKINAWLDNDEQRRQRGKPLGFYSTGVFEAIRALAKFCRSNAPDPALIMRGEVLSDQPHMALGYGPAGCGKSVGARALAAEDPTAILIRCDQRGGGARGLAHLIHEALGIRNRDRNLLDWTMDELRGSGRLLIVDEAHRLRLGACEFVRDLHDVCGVPILLLGTQGAFNRLTGVRMNMASLLYDQFSSRVGYPLNLVRGVDGRGGLKRPIFSIDEIRAIFRRDNLRITADAYEFLRDCACVEGLGMLRLAAGIFDKAARAATHKSVAIDERLLRSAAGRSLIPAGEIEAAVMTRIETTSRRNRELLAAAG